MAPSIISASRRTDIPAYYMPWFMAGIEEGFFAVRNPYNRKIATIPATPEDVHSIVFWSKDFGKFLDHGYGETLRELGYGLFFNFTINSAHPILEPNMPPLDQRLDQLTLLCERFGCRAVQWRFDPICHYIDDSGRRGDNLDHFTTIAAHAQLLGVSQCITSFVDLYRKVNQRTGRLADFTFLDPGLEQKICIIEQLSSQLNRRQIALALCCEKEVIAALPAGLGVQAAACIPAERLLELFGPGLAIQQDPGQRKTSGCGCNVSRDIGSYDWHPCPHNCLYCYANK